ncbi:MAG: SDR family oxidoreductase [Bdellovibrionales bacterium]
MERFTIVTGASRGIGLEIAKKFLSEGFTVINISRNISPLPNIVNISCDLSNDWELDELSKKISKVISSLGEMHLIHNASAVIEDSVTSVNELDLIQMLKLNVVSPAKLNKILVPFMCKNSSITYVGSTLSEKSVRDTFSYTTVKHAVVGMMKATAQDLFGEGIHTTCVCPGFTKTDMLEGQLLSKKIATQDLEKLVSFGRLISPAEIAKVVFFCSRNPVFNGSVIHANLGQLEL